MSFRIFEISLFKFTKLYGKFWESFLLEKDERLHHTISITLHGTDSHIKSCIKEVQKYNKNISKFRNMYWKDNYGLYYNNFSYDCKNNNYLMRISNKKKLDYARIKYGF